MDKNMSEKWERVNWLGRWREFSAETTLHGVRSTSSAGTSLARRVLWVVMVTSMCALYVTLAAVNIAAFYK